MPFTRRRAWWRGTAPAAGPGGAKAAGRRLPATAERRGILALRPQLVLASAQAQPSLVLHKVQASGVKVVNVPGGESLSAIDNKVAVIAEALGKTAAGDAAPATSATDRRHSNAAGC